MVVDTSYTLINRHSLPFDGDTYELEDRRYQDTEVSFIWVEMKPGGCVRLHKHPYEEIFIIQEGEAEYLVGSEIIAAHTDQIIIVPDDTAHKFSNTGEQTLRQVDIHVSRRFITERLEE
jgi:mannose-6-phosphate isomerase-like protein (cupin superfamily)